MGISSISFEAVCVKTPSGDELVMDDDLEAPTKKLTKRQMEAIIKASNEIHTRPTVKMPCVKVAKGV